MKVLCALLLALPALAELPLGEPLPLLKGEFLSGRKAVLPHDAAGRVSLLAVGFTYQSRFAVEAWVKTFRAGYGENPEVTFYEIPIIGGFSQLGKWFIDSGMRRGTPPADHEHVITVYGGADPWKQRLGYTAPGDAYLILLDKTGNVRWLYHGTFDQAAYDRLSAELKRFL